MLHAARGKWPEALRDAEVACGVSNPSFQAFAQKADVLIEMSDFPAAETVLDGLRPPNAMKRDVKIGLKCKLLLRQKKWREAEAQFNGLLEKESSVARMIRKEILEQKVMDTKVPKEERESAKLELKRIGELLQIPLVTDDEDEVRN